MRELRHPNAVGSALRGAREHLGMTQADVAAMSGVSRKWLGDAEGGKLEGQVYLVLRVLETLGYDMEFVPRSAPTEVEAYVQSMI